MAVAESPSLGGYTGPPEDQPAAWGGTRMPVVGRMPRAKCLTFNLNMSCTHSCPVFLLLLCPTAGTPAVFFGGAPIPEPC